ncbi:membrane progestin receptor beta-like [Amphiura filiformis]|uniref:membrane progestin receptor beta-like n=1 Tax=Amphiura filiformis TaxID=82378 RepID=UPI003B20E84B
MLIQAPDILAGFQTSKANLPPTRHVQEVPVLFREPHVQSGYREPYHPFTYYLKSFFQIHNESLNVWTHAIAFFCIMYTSASLCLTMDVLNDRYAQVFLVFCACNCCYLFLSMVAHLFQSHSELTHYTSFFMDYVGVSMCGVGSGLAHFHIVAHPSFFHFYGNYYMPINWIFSLLTCLCCGYAKYKYKRPYPYARKLWQMGSVGMGYIHITLPIAHRLLMDFSSIWDDNSLRHHSIQLIFFLCGAFFFAAPFPQKFFPGRCDIVGHGHQLFHVFMGLMTYIQTKGVYLDLISRRDIYSELYTPSLCLIYGYFFGQLIAGFFIVLLLREGVKAKIKMEKRS